MLQEPPGNRKIKKKKKKRKESYNVHTLVMAKANGVDLVFPPKKMIMEKKKVTRVEFRKWLDQASDISRYQVRLIMRKSWGQWGKCFQSNQSKTNLIHWVSSHWKIHPSNISLHT